MARTVYPAIPLARELQGSPDVCIARNSYTHACLPHTCTSVCNPPTRSLIPLIRSHFRPSWVRLRPFWYHLPLTRRSCTLLVGFHVHICACAHTSIHAPSREKVLEVTTREGKGEEDRGVAGEGWARGRGGRAYSGI